MEYTHVLVERSGDFATIMNNPAKRNADAVEGMHAFLDKRKPQWRRDR